MRSMNGFELVESIRQSGNKVGIFMITTEGGREVVIRALRLGANNYLVKPIDKYTLKQKITDYFKIGK
jgi:response regulator of citrate/malate metabolism